MQSLSSGGRTVYSMRGRGVGGVGSISPGGVGLVRYPLVGRVSIYHREGWSQYSQEGGGSLEGAFVPSQLSHNYWPLKKRCIYATSPDHTSNLCN